MKKRLIRSFGSDASDHLPLPQQYTCAKQRWLCLVSVENDAGMVDEYEIKPDRKLYLEDFLEIVSKEIEEFEDIDGTSWQVNIYRVSTFR